VPEGVETTTFFSIMGSFPSGVAVVTALDPDGAPRGLTVTALCSVSADPPLMLVCVGEGSNTLPAIRHSRRFAVNYLAAGRERLARLFASQDPDKFVAIPWQPAENGMPWLRADSLALAECTVTQEIPAGDHFIFIGRVEGGRVPDPGSHPLLYFRRGYRAVE
jgi:flavin reductase ActVB